MVSGILYAAISGWMENQIDNNLLLTATQVASVLYDPEDVLTPEDINLRLSSENLAAQRFLGDQLFFVRVLNRPDGYVVATSADNPVAITANARSAIAQFETLAFEDGESVSTDLRVYTLPLTYAPRYAVQVIVSLRNVREIQRDMLLMEGLLFALTVISAPLSGWFLASRALIPIRATARTAAEIHETDLTRRLDLAASDIELEQLGHTFNAMLDRIEGAFQRQRRFTADAAHELRTPLSIMQTGLEVTLSQERSAPQYRSALVTIQEEVQRLSKLTTTLLLLARADTHELPLVIESVQLTLLLHSVADQFRSLADDKRISLERAIAADLIVRGDEDRLIQVIFNLLDNALKYTPEGGTVRIMAEHSQHSVEIRVQDSGPGIPAGEQAHIFDRFYRVDQARNRRDGGFGLGLAIAKQIIELHGGSIQVKSETGQGAEFIVLLPL